MPHGYRNVGDVVAKVLWVNSPATFLGVFPQTRGQLSINETKASSSSRGMAMLFSGTLLSA